MEGLRQRVPGGRLPSSGRVYTSWPGEVGRLAKVGLSVGGQAAHGTEGKGVLKLLLGLRAVVLPLLLRKEPPATSDLALLGIHLLTGTWHFWDWARLVPFSLAVPSVAVLGCCLWCRYLTARKTSSCALAVLILVARLLLALGWFGLVRLLLDGILFVDLLFEEDTRAVDCLAIDDHSLLKGPSQVALLEILHKAETSGSAGFVVEEDICLVDLAESRENCQQLLVVARKWQVLDEELSSLQVSILSTNL